MTSEGIDLRGQTYHFPKYNEMKKKTYLFYNMTNMISSNHNNLQYGHKDTYATKACLQRHQVQVMEYSMNK